MVQPQRIIMYDHVNPVENMAASGNVLTKVHDLLMYLLSIKNVAQINSSGDAKMQKHGQSFLDRIDMILHDEKAQCTCWFNHVNPVEIV